MTVPYVPVPYITYTTNKSIIQPNNGSFADGWDVPVNTDWNIIDAALGGNYVLNPTGQSGIQALSLAEYQPLYLVVGVDLTNPATLTAGVEYQFPAGIGGQWSVYNNTTGAFNVTFSSAGGGTSVVIGQGNRALLICDGTNVSEATSFPSIVTPGGLSGQLQFNGAGSFAGAAGTNVISSSGHTVTGLTVTGSGTVATLNGVFSPIPVVNGLIEISGFATSGYNGLAQVITASGTTVTYSSTATAPDSGGVANYGEIDVAFTGQVGSTNFYCSAESVSADFTGPVGRIAPAEGVFKQAYTPPPSTITSSTAFNIDCSLSNVFSVTMSATATMTVSNPQPGQTINVIFTQGSGGSHTITWPAGFIWPYGTAGVLSTPAASQDVMVATYNGTSWFATLIKAFA